MTHQRVGIGAGKGVREMKIIIIGGGKVGFTLAKRLTQENHDLVLVDNDPVVLEAAESTLDILGVEGDGASVRTLLDAGARNADLVIAVTGYDEVNLMCCLLAKRLGVKSTIVRIRNPEYFKEAGLLKKEIGLDLVINPEHAAAMEITRLLRVPSAFSVETFARGVVEMIGFYVDEKSGLAGVSLLKYNRKNSNRVLVCAVIRKGEVTIPNGDFVPQLGDKVYVIGGQKDLDRFFQRMGQKAKTVRRVSLIGGSRIATYLSWELQRLGTSVKLVEQDREKCLWLSERLPHVLVIHGDGTDHDLIEAEGIFDCDAVVTLTGRDEENLLMALSAQRSGVKTVVAKMNRPNYIDMMRDFGVDSIISPKDITANVITAYVRSKSNSQGSAVEHLYKLLDGAVEAVSFTVTRSTDFLNIPLKDLRLKPGLLVAAIVRDGRNIIPDGQTEILEGDKVVVMAKSLFLQDLNDILE